MRRNLNIFMIPTSISAHWHYGVSNYFNVSSLEYLGRAQRTPVKIIQGHHLALPSFYTTHNLDQ